MSERVVQVIWSVCRRKDGTIDLRLAARQTGCYFNEAAMDYLSIIEELMPINSRQAAAIAIANALEIAAREKNSALSKIR